VSVGYPSEREADVVGRDVVSQPAGEAEQVVAGRQATERDGQPDTVEQEEQGVLAADPRARTVAEGPPAVAGVGHGGRDHGRQGLRGQRLVGLVKKQVEQADVDHECDGADHAELQ